MPYKPIPQDAKFELFGHLNGFGVYPASVLPVGFIIDPSFNPDDLIVSYKSGSQSDIIESLYDMPVPHSAKLRNRLQGFDVRRDCLYAFSQEDVESYERSKRREAFISFLEDERMKGHTSAAYSLAMSARSEDHIYAALSNSAKRIMEKDNDRGGLEFWYDSIVSNMDGKGLSPEFVAKMKDPKTLDALLRC